MKQAILLISLMLINSRDASSQPAYHKHSSGISIGYGFINVWKTFLDKIVDIPTYKVKATGPLTLIYEYGITNRFSAGISAGYSRVRGRAEKYQLYDQITFWSVLARANYHLWTGRKLDPYFGGGIGVSNSKYKNLDPHTIISQELNKNVPGNVDFSGQFGLTYMLCRRLGCYAEIGYVHGALLHVGAITRF
ncbi:MAG: outer membrane beta-barrel protein [Ferruginibacter sp.]